MPTNLNDPNDPVWDPIKKMDESYQGFSKEDKNKTMACGNTLKAEGMIFDPSCLITNANAVQVVNNKKFEQSGNAVAK